MSRAELPVPSEEALQQSAALVATIGCRNALPSEGHEVELAIVLPDATEIHQIN